MILTVMTRILELLIFALGLVLVLRDVNMIWRNVLTAPKWKAVLIINQNTATLPFSLLIKLQNAAVIQQITSIFL